MQKILRMRIGDLASITPDRPFFKAIRLAGIVVRRKRLGKKGDDKALGCRASDRSRFDGHDRKLEASGCAAKLGSVK
jgi:hypothetical protein